jgi:GT2 family glycosyltransferase
MIEEFQASFALSYICQPNRGRASACNAGIKRARGSVLLILDDDMEPTPECLARHLLLHPQSSRLGIMGAIPIRLDQTRTPAAAYVAMKFNRHLERLAQPDHTPILRDFASGHFSIPRQVMLEVGGFDESFRIYGNEDLELALRLTAAGVKLIYSPEALAFQSYTKDFAMLARDTIAKGKTAVLLASKHPEAFASLELANYKQASRRWQWARSALLKSTRLVSHTADAVMALFGLLERSHVRQPELLYRFILDYFYWLGAESAMQENRRTGHGLVSLSARIDP